MRVISDHEEQLYAIAAREVAISIRKQLATGYCRLGIVGGRSMPALLTCMLQYAHELRGKIDVFWLDERIDNEKNYVPALPILEKFHSSGVDMHWYPLQSTHQQTIEVEAHQAMQHLAAAGKPEFDVIICSAGEDGHVASLFPQHKTLATKHAGYVIEEHAPKMPPLRITVTPLLMLTARSAFLFFVGEKRQAYSLFTNPAVAPADCPAKLLLEIPDLTVFTALK